ncbi:MAG: 2-oxoacid:acceptor oxidoreductase family protein [Bacteroidales bacterium]|nr:2-oxoacid:acceptor oxidoreductase family protein [Bacteroidales bacterium]MBN2819577.1 2-oxoacid:acceptor oxidoreductase family protein [Bacteroidales bacterium]
MNEEIIIAGFGGQGVLSMGKILAYSGIMRNLEVSWMPSYGPEMRGGTANVTVILSEERISSPIINIFDSAIILNQQSLDKFERKVRPGGLLLYDTNGITRHPERTDIDIYQVEAAAESARIDNLRVFNMIVLGAYLKLKDFLKLEHVIEGLEKSLPPRYHHLIEANADALKIGMNIVKPYSAELAK